MGAGRDDAVSDDLRQQSRSVRVVNVRISGGCPTWASQAVGHSLSSD
jgi:hypothetical protein